jgi:hypothetical protein
MKKKAEQDPYLGKWLLIDKRGKVIFASENIADVVEEGRKYKLNEVFIEKRFYPGPFAFNVNIGRKTIDTKIIREKNSSDYTYLNR